MSNVIDSFFVALGFTADMSGLKEIKKGAESARASMLSFGNAIKGVVTGFALKGLADIGSQFEQTRIQIAGYFTALGQSPDFAAGLKDADEALNLITIAAAKLPGEAEEYQQVFMDTFSFVKGAVGGSIEEMTNFTNTLTAIGKAGKLDTGQIARETDELLAAGTGHAMTRNRLWMQLFPLMRQLKGEAHLTKEAFNAMTETKRADLMRQTFAKLQPMLDASANSFDAMWGAMKSGIKILIRLGTANLFDGMKKGLDALNAVFFDSKGKVTSFGQNVIDNLKKVSGWIVQLVKDGAQLVKWFSDLKYSGPIAKAAIVGLTVAFMGLNKALSTGILGVFILLLDDLIQFETGGKSVTGMLVKKWHPALRLIQAALILLGAKIVGLPLGLMGKMIGNTIGLVGQLTGKLIGLIVKLVATGVAWALANLPIFLTLVALGLVMFALYELGQHWSEVIDFMVKKWHEFIDPIMKIPGNFKKIFGFGTAEENAALEKSRRDYGSGDQSASRAPGGPIIWRNPATGLEETHTAGWSPPMSATMTGVDAGAGRGATSTTSTASTTVSQVTHVGTVNINGNDPKQMERDWKRIIRSGQSPVGQ